MRSMVLGMSGDFLNLPYEIIWILYEKEFFYKKIDNMSYSELAQLEILDAVNCIKTQSDLDEFKNLIAHFFARKAQKSIDDLWESGVVSENIIEEWGKEHMRTPYRK